MDINIHNVTEIGMEEEHFDSHNFSVITIRIETKDKGSVALKLFHPKGDNVLFNFIDGLNTTTTQDNNGDVIKFEPHIAWKEVV
jgi:hypothetical protein